MVATSKSLVRFNAASVSLASFSNFRWAAVSSSAVLWKASRAAMVVFIFSLTWTKLRTPAASPRTMAAINDIRNNMATDQLIYASIVALAKQHVNALCEMFCCQKPGIKLCPRYPKAPLRLQACRWVGKSLTFSPSTESHENPRDHFTKSDDIHL